ncbi:MAG: SOS response-associated peptidase family protein [Methylocella sp.]|nr:MAG: hypothetical protein DLM68_07735 [Hyphomicrobiales bacterium]
MVPLTGFYEWETTGKPKQPSRFTMADEQPLALAGLWEFMACSAIGVAPKL